MNTILLGGFTQGKDSGWRGGFVPGGDTGRRAEP
jgi:hypothetical protein